jgi:hypothetical protein
VVISIVLYALGIIGLIMILPMILAMSGVWLMVLAGIKTSNPEQYDRGPFSTFAWGLFLLALGGAWFLYGYGYGWLYSIALVLVVLAILAIATAMKRG